MSSELEKLFFNEEFINKIKKNLPVFFQLAEIDNERNGKLGMEIGSTREKILIAILIHELKDENVNYDVPITTPEIDVFVYQSPISIKSLTSKYIKGVKIIWTVDSKKAKEFIKDYIPTCDILLVHISWNNNGGLYLISNTAQKDVLKFLGTEKYFKLPKEGTNSRGVEITKEAINLLSSREDTKFIEIFWTREENLKYSAYDRWIEMWKTKIIN